MPHLSLSLLGPLQITLDGMSDTAFESDKVRALLVYLAVEADQPHRRSALAGLLWPDRPERTALLNLNQALANLRRGIGDREAAVPFLLVARDAIQFNRAADYALDSATFTELLEACRTHTHRNPATCTPCARRLAEAVALYRGAFLEEFAPRDSQNFGEWTVVLRERLHRQMLEALDWLTTYHEHRQDHAAALSSARQLLELDPWREETHRQVMRLLYTDGQRSVALAQYERCREVLAEELGLEPEEETEELYEQILAGDKEIRRQGDKEIRRQGDTDSSSQSPGLLVSLSEKHSLPTPPTPFLGREAELAQLADYLSNPACRLVTIVGLGGSGKTRLALEAASEQGSVFADGVCFVALAAIANSSLLLPTIATTLGLTLGSGEDVEAQLGAHLRERELLLVLDNMEQLRDGVSALGLLLSQAPRLTILATSRERLQLQGEWVLELGGLQVPATAAPDAIETSSATALFLQAARRARGAFAPHTDERQAITRICAMLAGHPLGIELAASWTHVLSCSEIETELAGSLELLASTTQDLPERHRTLHAVLDASWHLLNDDERRGLGQMSVFRGGFTREAAATVAGVNLPRLAVLINRSWLHRAADGRYNMHEFIRQYGAEQLERAGNADETWERQVAFFLALVEQAEPQLKGADEAIWMERLTIEHDNLRAALDHALTHDLVEQAARICAVLRWFWYLRGYIDEGRRWLQQVLAATKGSALPQRLQARLFQATGIFADEQGDYAQAANHYEKALALYRALDDTKGIQTTMNSRGMLASAQGDYVLAQACYEESLRLAHQLGNTWGIANGLNSLGSAVQAQGDCTRALAYYEEALPVARSTEYDPLITMVLDNIGEVALALDDIPRARTAYTEALTRQQAQNDTRGAALSMHGLGLVMLAEGKPEQAAHHLREGLALSWQTASKRELTIYLDNIAALLMAQGKHAQAIRICSVTDATRIRIGTPLTPFEQARHAPTLAAIRTNLDEATFSNAWATGQATPIETLISELLESKG